MTREEEIFEAMLDAELDIKNIKTLDASFLVLEGAKLADRTMIAKACKWLKDYAHMYVSETTGDLYVDDLVNAFRKDMEGQ